MATTLIVGKREPQSLKKWFGKDILPLIVGEIVSFSSVVFFLLVVTIIIIMRKSIFTKRRHCS